MDLDAAGLVQAFDRIGIVAFALGGVQVGMRRRLDVFGLLVMGVVTATGGGLIRDVVIGRVPFVLEHGDYLLLATVSSVAGIALAWRRRTIPKPLLAVADAAGLGAFAAAGALAGVEAGLPLPAVIVLAIVTATGGGVIRDLLADRVPLVLRAEVNATAAAIGGLVTWAVEPASVGAAALAGALTASGVRGLTIALNVHLPAPGGRRATDDDAVS
ncbi:MAG: TRIC cation channel family protein [Dehalococcoidia bacterium]|nr:TRIC cation channel family protein [Dehalococcoidia bacterium]